jgi:hypothetical protein
MTLIQLLMLLVAIPAAIWACIQIYDFFAKRAAAKPRAPKPISQKRTRTLTWTSEVIVLDKK